MLSGANLSTPLHLYGLTGITIGSALLILAPGIIYDFFWQIVVRVSFVAPTRILRHLHARRYKRRLVTYEEAVKESIERIDSFRKDLAAAQQSKDPPDESRIRGLLISEIGRRDHLKEALERFSTPEFLPRISIIVPCHNSSDVIEDTIKSLLALSYKDKEIIIVDDASTDDTFAKAQKYASQIRLVRREESTGRKTGAVNFGITFATGEVVAVVDDDTVIGANSLQALVQPMSDPVVAAVGANIRIRAAKENLLTLFQRIEYLTTMEIGKQFQSYAYKAVFVISGAYGAFVRSYLERIGHYDVDIITEDLDVTWKLYALKKRVVYVPQAVAWTDVPVTWRVLVKQRIRWERGLYETLVKHRHFIFRRKYGTVGMLLLPETLFEVIMLLIRPFYIVALILFGQNILNIVVLLIYFYIFIEVISIVTAALVSEHKSSIWLVILAIPAAFYRQTIAFVRYRAFIAFLFGKHAEW